MFTKAHFLTRATSQLAVSVPVVVHHPDHRTSGSLDSYMLGGSHVQICPTRAKKKNRICEVHCPVASLDFPNKVKKVAGLMHGCVSLRIQAESGSFEHLLEIRQWNVFV